MITDINSEDRLVQKTFTEHLEKVLGWESVYAYNNETLGPQGTLGRASERDVVLVQAVAKLGSAREKGKSVALTRGEGKLPQPVAKIGCQEIVQQPVAQIP
jgi:hypothetical protein